MLPGGTKKITGPAIGKLAEQAGFQHFSKWGFHNRSSKEASEDPKGGLHPNEDFTGEVPLPNSKIGMPENVSIS